MRRSQAGGCTRGGGSTGCEGVHAVAPTLSRRLSTEWHLVLLSRTPDPLRIAQGSKPAAGRKAHGDPRGTGGTFIQSIRKEAVYGSTGTQWPRDTTKESHEHAVPLPPPPSPPPEVEKERVLERTRKRRVPVQVDYSSLLGPLPEAESTALWEGRGWKGREPGHPRVR